MYFLGWNETKGLSHNPIDHKSRTWCGLIKIEPHTPTQSERCLGVKRLRRSQLKSIIYKELGLITIDQSKVWFKINNWMIFKIIAKLF